MLYSKGKSIFQEIYFLKNTCKQQNKYDDLVVSQNSVEKKKN